MLFTVAGGSILYCQYEIIACSEGRIYSTIQELPNNEIGLLPGTAPLLVNGQANPWFEYRVAAAALLYHCEKIKHILVSGDNHHIYYNEPEALRQALIKKGVPHSSITLDYAGFRTFDSVVRAKKIFGVKKCTVISQELHNRRILFLCTQYEIDAVAFNARTPRHTSGQRFRELLAGVKAVCDIWIIGNSPRFLGPEEPIALYR